VLAVHIAGSANASELAPLSSPGELSPAAKRGKSGRARAETPESAALFQTMWPSDPGAGGQSMRGPHGAQPATPGQDAAANQTGLNPLRTASSPDARDIGQPASTRQMQGTGLAQNAAIAGTPKRRAEMHAGTGASDERDGRLSLASGQDGDLHAAAGEAANGNRTGAESSVTWSQPSALPGLQPGGKSAVPPADSQAVATESVAPAQPDSPAPSGEPADSTLRGVTGAHRASQTLAAAGWEPPARIASGEPKSPDPASAALAAVLAQSPAESAPPNRLDAHRSAEESGPARNARAVSGAQMARSAETNTAASSATETAEPSRFELQGQVAFTGHALKEESGADASAPSADAAPAESSGENPGGAFASVAPVAHGGSPAAVRARDAAPLSGSGIETRAEAAAGGVQTRAAAEDPQPKLAGGGNAQTAPARLTAETAAAPPKPVRDITLELDSGSQRAAVRLVERGGEVHFAVRTPDAALATDLRQGLPALAARLEQTGFRPVNWHPGTAARDPADGSAGAAGQNRGGQDSSGSQQERHHGSQQQPESGDAPRTKKEGRNFAWFMSSLG